MQERTDKISQLEASRDHLLKELEEKTRRLGEMADTAHALSKSQSNLQSLLHCSTEGIIVLGSDGLIQSINKAAESILGYAEIELIHQAPGPLFACHPDHKHDIPGFIKSHIANFQHSNFNQKANRLDNPIFGITSKKELVPLAVTYGEVLDEDLVLFNDDGIDASCVENTGNKFELFCIIIRDLTQEMQVQEELRHNHEQLRSAYLRLSEAKQLQSEIMANVSHELRTPLNGILGISELLKQSSLDKQQRKYLSAIVDSGEKLLGVVDKLVEYCNLESHDHSAVFSQINFVELNSHLRALFQKLSGNKPLGLSIDTEIADYGVISEQNYVKKVISNLLENAIKFSQKGEICISWRVDPTKNHLLVAISDQGIGIPKDKHKVIFEPFLQLDGSTSRKYDGMGMGLAVCKQLLEELNAEIWVDPHSGEGTTFKLRIPVKLAVIDATLMSKSADFNSGLEQQLQQIEKILGEGFPSFVSSFLAETGDKMRYLKSLLDANNMAMAAAVCDNLSTACETLGLKQLPASLSTLSKQLMSGQAKPSSMDEVYQLYSQLQQYLKSKMDNP